jgi:hypothetical protein
LDSNNITTTKNKVVNKEISLSNEDIHKSPVKLDKYSIRTKPAPPVSKGTQNTITNTEAQPNQLASLISFYQSSIILFFADINTLNFHHPVVRSPE